MGSTHDGSERARRRFWNVAAKPCDFCNSAAALLFCSAESAFMCITCDDKVHNADGEMAAVRHWKVWMCEVCEQAPAAVTCKADAASLCITCDRDIHSANPLAQRHDRVSVVPFYDAAESVLMKSNADSISDWKLNDYIPDLWSSTNLVPEMKSMELLILNSDEFLDFDSVVPKQPPSSAQLPENRFEINFTRSDITSYKNTASLSHSVSSSSTDVGLVPDGRATVSETSYPFTVNSIVNHGSQAAGMDRKARVLRYREKRKNRKFEKTIRYVSRKAYAETRPRIKGRFAKKTDSESEIDGILGFSSGNRFSDPRYG